MLLGLADSWRPPLIYPFDKLYEQRLFTPAAVSRRSPLNNPFDKLYLVLRPIRRKISPYLPTSPHLSPSLPISPHPSPSLRKSRALLHSIAAGHVPLSELDRVFHDFPWGERVEGDGGRWGTSTLLRSGK